MDQIYRALLGDAGANLRSGKPVSAADVGNSALTIGLNALPVGGAGAAAKGAKAAAPIIDNAAARAILNSTLKNPQFSVAMPKQNAIQMLRSGQYQNKFQRGATDPYRMGKEESVLNIPMGTPVAERPVYGILTNRVAVPESIAKRIPGKTGEVARMVSPTANESLGMYGGADGIIASAPTRNLPTTYTTTDSFYAPAGSVRQVGDKAARRDAINEIMGRLDDNTYRSNARFIEGQIPSSANPLAQTNRIRTAGESGRLAENARDIALELSRTGRPGVKVVPGKPAKGPKPAKGSARPNLDRIFEPEA